MITALPYIKTAACHLAQTQTIHTLWHCFSTILKRLQNINVFQTEITTSKGTKGWLVGV